ncbi:MAG TPA: YncE family protein [Acidobacteriaceae bacterium]|jgi:YVTN family beta-propeller protein|nr:YncE family protein [Acidobacteriaceae bacterium]
MKKCLVVVVIFLSTGVLRLAAQTPQATEIPGKLFDIQKTWTIGGEGNWDYLTFDPSGSKLFIAHGPVVQVVDVNEGKLTGEVKGLHDAHEIALDDHGQYGYVSDGESNDVKVFDRDTLEIVATVPTGKGPRAVVFEPATRLVFVICPMTSEEARPARRTGSSQRNPSLDSLVKSTITVIDADTQKPLADMLLPGKLGFAQADSKGTVYLNVTDRNQITYFDAQAIESRLRKLADSALPDGGKPALAKSSVDQRNSAQPNVASSDETASRTPARSAPFTVDWSDPSTPNNPLRSIRLGQSCESPRGLAIDSNNLRLFVACDNMQMQVLDATDGHVMTTLPIGAGTDAIGYDPTRGLIYASNGGGVGSLTIIRQHLTDSYAVIQELPTRARARTLAVNPSSGEVYLVTNVTGFDLTHNGGIGGLKTAALAGSFQVLVVGSLSN